MSRERAGWGNKVPTRVGQGIWLRMLKFDRSMVRGSSSGPGLGLEGVHK